MDQDVNDGTRIGGRVALKLQPNENVTITPRVIYQEVDMDGYNRQDIWNILANPYTTTETPIEIGDRQQYTQLQEKFTDDFLLGDLTMAFDLGRRGADVDQFLHGPRHPRDPRRDAADRQRDLRHRRRHVASAAVRD